MSKMELIFRPIEGDLERFKKRYKEVLSGDRASKMDFVNYILKIEGKGLRPVLLFLTAHLHGEINDKSVNSAVILELTHTASLVHDDIVDEAFQRRGKFSINALWRSKKAVLIGDYIFSKAILTASQNELYNVLGDVARVIEAMSIGELEQSDATICLDITEARYFEVIRCKTASLMSCASKLGAVSVGASEQDCAKMEKLGEIIGIMFQIKDDILDYMGGSTGKMAGNDLKEHKITLPLIYALKKGDKSEVNTILKLLRESDEKKGYISKITSYVVEKGGIILSQKKIDSLREEAKEILASYPESQYKKSLLDLIDFVTERDK